MNEASRQSYLKALGLTPWVACAPLPGAAPSPWLEWEAEQDARSPAPAAVQTEPAAPSPGGDAAPQPALRDSLTAAPTPAPEQKAQESAREPVQATPAKGEALVFTLEAHLGNQTWLLCAQEDSQAPGLGRCEAPLMSSLLALFQGRPGRPRRFFCPLTETPMQAGEAAQALSAFIASLCEQAGGERVLLSLPESLNQALFDQPRYQPFEIGGHPALVISALSEMLADPVAHKKASWQAMQEHGFDGT